MSTESHLGGSDPDTTGRAVPPYEGRRETADVDPQDHTTKDGAKTAGATGPVQDDQPKAADPDATERGAVASPADEQPAVAQQRLEYLVSNFPQSEETPLARERPRPEKPSERHARSSARAPSRSRRRASPARFPWRYPPNMRLRGTR